MLGSMLHALHMLFYLILAINIEEKRGVVFWSFVVVRARLNLQVN